ncbi:MAG: M28 family peptidase [Solirubrobacteraceae bacterium]
MTGTTDPGTDESWRASHRGLVVVLGVQVVIGAALLIWVAMGRPVPGLVQNADGKGNPNATTPVPTTNHFDGAYAFALLQRQVEHYGPRPAGSAKSYALAKDLVKRLPNGTFEPVPEPDHNVIKRADGSFYTAPHTLRNIVGTLPGKGAPIVIGAHYDTEASIPGHVGANDGAAGTAAVVELARALSTIDRGPSAPPLRFVLFDGEEEPGNKPDPKVFESVALRGSKFEAEHQPKPQAMILLDYIAQAKGLRLPREGFSDKTIWKKLQAASVQVGTQRIFPNGTGEPILDDHYPFRGAGIPAIDLIDWDYPVADTLQDDIHHVSELSLDAVGETVLQMLRTWR